MGGKKNEWNDLLTQFPDDIQNGEMWGILFTTSVESWIIQKKIYCKQHCWVTSSRHIMAAEWATGASAWRHVIHVSKEREWI